MRRSGGTRRTFGRGAVVVAVIAALSCVVDPAFGQAPPLAAAVSAEETPSPAPSLGVADPSTPAPSPSPSAPGGAGETPPADPEESAPPAEPGAEPTAPAPEPSEPPPPEEESAPPSAEESEDDLVAQDASSDSLLPEASAIAPVIPAQSRLTGSDRYALSVAVSKAAFPAGADTVLIASGDQAIGGMLAAGLAAQLSAPLLYVKKSTVPAAVAAEISRLGPTSVVVVGSAKYVSAAVLDRLAGLARDVRRFVGADRYETSRMALLERGGQASTVYLAGGEGALLGPPLAWVAAAATGQAALLVDGLASAPDAATLDALRAVGARNLVIVGGAASMGAAYESSLRAAGFGVGRRSGDRFATAIAMASERSQPAQRAIIANPSYTANVALGAALAAATGQQLYYSDRVCVRDDVSAHIASLGIPVTAIGSTSSLEAAVAANRSCTQERIAREGRLRSAIQSTLSQYNGGAGFSVTVREVGGLGQYAQIGGSVRREPASMMKLFAAWAALKKIETGSAGFGTRLPSGVDVSTCLFVMIHVSDNYCHTDIVHWIGIAELNRMIRAAGFLNTAYGTVAPGVSVLYAGNRSTTDDLVRLISQLTEATALSRPYADHLLSLMEVQIFRTRIPSGIPPGVAQASKPGALWIAAGLLQADTAVVYSPAGTYLISIIGDQGPPQAALRAVSRTVYQHFNGSFGSAMSYPAQQMVTVRATALRTSPGGPTSVVVPAGTPIQVNDANRTWYKVQWGSRELWTVLYDLKNR
ncbi:serine hydrolase [Microbacterium sp. NPDC019599]|uniref:serine hydrolase n=1 Tax=Microbacterium sp. NPDC019599 TaxID=3154690 RepID=UPI0033FB2545